MSVIAIARGTAAATALGLGALVVALLLPMASAATIATAAAPTTTTPLPTPRTLPTPTLPSIPSPPSSAPVTRSAHVPFENCSAKDITLTVTLPRHTFELPSLSKTPVAYRVTLQNAGGTPCGSHAPGSSSLRRALSVGPCGTLSSVVYDAFGMNVYPGSHAVYFCPEFGGNVYVPAHGSVATTGSWSGVEDLATGVGPPQYHPAPPGAYWLVVGSVRAGTGRARAVTVPFTLVALAPAPAP